MSTYPEPLVARVTGLKKAMIVDARQKHLVKGEGWLVVDSVPHFTADGLKKICSALGLDAAGLQWPADPAPAAPEGTPATDTAEQPAHPEALKQPLDGAPHPAESAQKNSSVAAQPPADPAPAASAADDVAKACDALAADAKPVEVYVTTIPHNKRIVLGQVDDSTAKSGTRPVTVQVRDNSNFKPGLYIRATRASDSFYHMVGRPPRWRGDRVGFEKTPAPKEPSK